MLQIDQAIKDLLTLEADKTLWSRDALDLRVKAQEELAFIGEIIRANQAEAKTYGERIAVLGAQLDAANEQLYTSVRQWLRSGTWTREAVHALFERYSARSRGEGDRLHLDYEPVDQLVDGILELEAFEGLASVHDPDIVHLEDTPVSVLLELVDHVPLEDTDHFCDLGSGLGRAAIVVHWLTGVPVQGIEIQPDYCGFSRRLAASFGLTDLTFAQADAREADLSAGTVFYLFTPFKGRILDIVFKRLAREAQQRPITVCTYGAISLIAAQQPWLRSFDGQEPHAFALAIWQSL